MSSSAQHIVSDSDSSSQHYLSDGEADSEDYSYQGEQSIHSDSGESVPSSSPPSHTPIPISPPPPPLENPANVDAAAVPVSHSTCLPALPLCYLAEYDDKYQRLEQSDRCLVPTTILQKIHTSLGDELPNPLIFQLTREPKDSGQEEVNVLGYGTVEFLEGIDHIYLSNRLIQQLWIQYGDHVMCQVCTEPIPKGTGIKLQPHTSNFLTIDNPKKALEDALRYYYSILHEGDVISLKYQNQTYDVTVVETKPDSPILSFNTDLEVDFLPPLDYVPPPVSHSPVVSNAAVASTDETPPENSWTDQDEWRPFCGKGYRLGS